MSCSRFSASSMLRRVRLTLENGRSLMSSSTTAIKNSKSINTGIITVQSHHKKHSFATLSAPARAGFAASVASFFGGATSETKEEGRKFLEENSKQPHVVCTPSGLQYKILKSGPGQAHPTPYTPCDCHYEGKLLNGKKFDSSYDRGLPTTFAPNQVIPGWTEAMQLMVEGDCWELYIPPELAYGDRGAGPVIPGGATLVFKMEIIKIKGSTRPKRDF